MYHLSLLIFTNKETDSLKYTITEFMECVDVAYDIVVLLKAEHCPSAQVVQDIMCEHPDWHISTAVQKTQDRFGYFQELITLATGTHFMVWPSDNEVDIQHVKEMLPLSVLHPDSLVSLSKFHKDSVLEGYGRFRTSARKALNSLIRILYHREGTDFFSTFEIFPRCYLERFRYSQNRNVVFEYNLVPLKMGVEYMELPMVYRKREEGKSNFGFIFYSYFAMLYVFRILAIFLTPENKLLRNKAELSQIYKN